MSTRDAIPATQTNYVQSPSQIITTNKSHPTFLKAGSRSYRPTISTAGKMYHVLSQAPASLSWRGHASSNF